PCYAVRRFRRSRNRQLTGELLAEDSREVDWNGVSYETQTKAPTATAERVVIGETLQTRCLTDAEVADATVAVAKHVLTARDAVNSRLNRLRGPIPGASVMAVISTRTRLMGI